MTMKLTSQEKKELNKLTKCLVLQAAQLIVDSRMEGLTSTPCNPSSDPLGFNLAIKEVPDVVAAISPYLNAEPAVVSKIPLCLEIYLHEVRDIPNKERADLLLESWCFAMSHDQCTEYMDPFTKSDSYRVIALLKSLVSVARVTPAYKLSRRQGPDRYFIKYKFMQGMLDKDREETELGPNFKVVKVGQLCTPVGAIHLTLSYRTVMEMPPTRKDNPINIKSDYYTEATEDLHLKTVPEITKLAAFVSHRPRIDEKPALKIPALFTSSWSDTEEDLNVEEEPVAKEDEQNGNASVESQSSNLTMTSTDGFIMVDLQKPLFKSNKDLTSFLTEFRTPESLNVFKSIPTFEEQAPNFVNVVKDFEEEASKYSEMVNTFDQSENNN